MKIENIKKTKLLNEIKFSVLSVEIARCPECDEIYSIHLDTDKGGLNLLPVIDKEFLGSFDLNIFNKEEFRNKILVDLESIRSEVDIFGNCEISLSFIQNKTNFDSFSLLIRERSNETKK